MRGVAERAYGRRPGISIVEWEQCRVQSEKWGLVYSIGSLTFRLLLEGVAFPSVSRAAEATSSASDTQNRGLPASSSTLSALWHSPISLPPPRPRRRRRHLLRISSSLLHLVTIVDANSRTRRSTLPSYSAPYPECLFSLTLANASAPSPP